MKGLGSSRRHIAIVTGFLIAATWAAIGVWAVSERSRTISASEAQLSQLAVAVEEQTFRLFKVTEVSLVAATEWLTNHATESPNTTPGFVRLVDQLRRLSDGAMDIRTISRNGDLRQIPDPTGQPLGNVLDRESIRAQADPQTRGFYIGQPTVSPANNKWIIPVTFPVESTAAPDVAVIAGVLDLSRVVAIFEAQRIKPRGSITIIRADGVSLFRAPTIEGIIGQSIADSPDFIEQFSRKDHGSYRIDGVYDRINRLISFRLLKHYNLIIAVTVPTEDLLSHWREDLFALSLAGIIASALFWTFAVKLIRSMTVSEQARRHLSEQSARLETELAERREAESALRQSEAKLQALVTQAPLGIWMLDHDGCIIECNDTFTGYAGASRADIIGFNMFTDARDQSLSAPLHRAMAGETVNFETEYTSTTGGKTSTFHYILKPITIDGDFIFLMCITEDVNERKLMERAISDVNLRYDRLVRNISVGVYVFHAMADGTGRFDYVSPRFCQILDLDEEAVLRDPTPAFMAAHPDDRDGLIQASQAAIAGLLHFEWEGRFVIRGEIHWIRIESEPTEGPAGERLWNGVVSDISERKTLEIALLRSNAELEQFAYVASHDLREPLRMVSSYMGLLERRYGGQLDEGAHEFIAFARDGAVRMDCLVRDLLEFSRVGRTPEQPSPVNMGEVVATALTSLQVAITESEARIVVAPDLPVITCRAAEIGRLFQNLIANALKYRHAERTPKIEISAVREHDGWRFAVADNGIGIQEAYADKIFGIFQRLHTREKYDGTGIGLAICKKIVEHHGGRIRVESVLGEGSTFFFTLPDVMAR
ncbi:MAG: ATP-binding protein [Phaeospirillum sp.]|nr:ATP-binding protein [Phaeospirillum sp.]